ncbi:MAG: hypothetical protein ABI665_03690 [Vicinamibacterales bacterium]
MTGINWTRVGLGGLVAGLVMNAGEAALHGGILGADAQALAAQYQINAPASAVPIASLVATTFVLGIAAVWLYAAIRPRYGAGPKTAMLAGFAVWVMAHLWSGVYLGMGIPGLVTARLAFLPIAWGLAEAALATLAGAWFYSEAIGETASRRTSRETTAAG